MIDVARDPRWGRIAEGPGEDPHVAARFAAAAKVRGFQGPDHSHLSGLAATPKHLAAYGAATAGRDYAPVDVSDRTLAEVNLPPFRAAVEAGAAALMPGFTDIAGIPLTAHRALLTGLLRERWGFHGVVISDYGAIGELVGHGLDADLAEAAALALNAGVDVDMMSFAYEKGLPGALDRGLVAAATIDAAVLRVLDLKARLGLLADPYRRCTAPDPPPPPRPQRARASAALQLDRPAGQPDGPSRSPRPRGGSPSSARWPTRRRRCSGPGPEPGAATRRSASSQDSAPPCPAPRSSMATASPSRRRHGRHP